MYLAKRTPAYVAVPTGVALRPIGPRRRPGIVRASDDEDIVPIITGRRKKNFTEAELAHLKHPHLLGGKTVGEELALIRERYVAAEHWAEDEARARLTSAQWDGDVYIGPRWNTLSVLYLVGILSPAVTGLFAWLSYGHLWGVTPGLY